MGSVAATYALLSAEYPNNCNYPDTNEWLAVPLVGGIIANVTFNGKYGGRCSAKYDYLGYADSALQSGRRGRELSNAERPTRPVMVAPPTDQSP